jgi:predicted esterase
VRYRYGHESFLLLKAAGANIDFKTYRGLRHGINPTELSDMTEFLTGILNA